ncbi:unnamed protein product [Calypogeia fissa]
MVKSVRAVRARIVTLCLKGLDHPRAVWRARSRSQRPFSWWCITKSRTGPVNESPVFAKEFLSRDCPNRTEPNGTRESGEVRPRGSGSGRDPMFGGTDHPTTRGPLAGPVPPASDVPYSEMKNESWGFANGSPVFAMEFLNAGNGG